MYKNLIDSSALSAFSSYPKTTVFGHRANRSGIRRLTIKTDYTLKTFFVDSDREKDSASNVTIFNRSFTDIDGVLGQKLIFRSFL